MIDPRFYLRRAPLALAVLVDGLADGLLAADVAPADSARVIAVPASLDDAGPDAIAFYDGKGRPTTRAGAVLVRAVPEDVRADDPAWVVVTHPRAAFARIAPRLVTPHPWPSGETRIAESAVIEATAIIGPGAVIGAQAHIGAGTVIGPNAVIGPGVTVGRKTVISPGCVIQCALIGDGVTILPGTQIGQAGFGVAEDALGLVDMPHFGRVIIQDHVTIGAACTIDRGMLRDTVLGEHAKLDNLCHIAHNVIVGRGVRMAAFAGVSGSTEMQRSAQARCLRRVLW
jgi:UDP-3-O-[3-hydroxymyristoyl] glucosamine N-acyltransferase